MELRRVRHAGKEPTMTDPAELPPLPEPAYQWIDDYYDGWWCMNAVPDDRYSTLDTFTAEQMRAYGLACALAEREACAKLCETMKTMHNGTRNEGRPPYDDDADTALDEAAAAIRARGEVK